MDEQTRPSPVPSSQRLGNEAAVAAAQNAHPLHVLGVGSLSSVASAHPAATLAVRYLKVSSSRRAKKGTRWFCEAA